MFCTFFFFNIYALHLEIVSTVHKSISVMNENDLETNLSEDMAGILREGVQQNNKVWLGRTSPVSSSLSHSVSIEAALTNITSLE